jgi:hypothetical protein
LSSLVIPVSASALVYWTTFSRDDLISTLGMSWRGFTLQETTALIQIDGGRCLRSPAMSGWRTAGLGA